MDAIYEIPAEDRQLLNAPWGSLGRTCTLGIVSGVAKFLLTIANTTKVQNQMEWNSAVFDRPDGIGLLTVANHTSMFDDPGILSALTPWSFFWTEAWHERNRWTLCAKEVCFRNELLRQFFANGKTLPVVRGAGVEQPVVHLAASQLSKGGWVHIFPEGRIHFSGQLGPFKWGTGKMICEARKANGGRDPVILPFFHSGMGKILPMNSWIPRLGNTLEVAIGQPVDVSDITCDCNKPGVDQRQVWARIVSRIKEKMQELEKQVPTNINQVPDRDPVTEGYNDANTAPS